VSDVAVETAEPKAVEGIETSDSAEASEPGESDDEETAAAASDEEPVEVPVDIAEPIDAVEKTDLEE